MALSLTSTRPVHFPENILLMNSACTNNLLIFNSLLRGQEEPSVWQHKLLYLYLILQNIFVDVTLRMIKQKHGHFKCLVAVWIVRISFWESNQMILTLVLLQLQCCPSLFFTIYLVPCFPPFFPSSNYLYPEQYTKTERKRYFLHDSQIIWLHRTRILCIHLELGKKYRSLSKQNKIKLWQKY